MHQPLPSGNDRSVITETVRAWYYANPELKESVNTGSNVAVRKVGAGVRFARPKYCEIKFRQSGYTLPSDPSKLVWSFSYYDLVPVIGPPWPLASAPFLSQETGSGCLLSWKPSVTDSTEDAPITYIVEMCEVPRNDWHPIAHGIHNFEYEVIDLLKPDRNYHFRLRAENKFGVSDPSPYARTDRKLPARDHDHYAVKPSDRKAFEMEPREYDVFRPEHGRHGEKPRFYRENNDVQFGLEGETGTLEVYCYGYPQPKISWLFRGEEIKTGGRFASRYGTSGQVQLSIDKLSFRDVGEYVCRAVNEHGEAQITLRLEVAGNVNHFLLSTLD